MPHDPSLPQAIIQVGVTPMLARRALTAEQVSQAVLGTRVAVREERARWARIVTPDGYEGWVPARALSRRPYPPATEVVEITDLWANLRPRPDSKLPSWMTAFIGCRLNLRERRDGWWSLELPDGRIAWIEAHRARLVGPKPPTSPESVLATAARFLGVPYLWGGCTPFGLDCSGFVQLVFGLVGEGLPRDAHEQATCGEGVDREVVAPADLLYFGRDGGRDRRITHVAIAEGDGAFIHACGGRAVQRDRLDSEEFSTRFVLARRILGTRV